MSTKKSDAKKSTSNSSTNTKSTSTTSTYTLFILFIAWYAFNAAYNVYNAYVKDDLPYPFFAAIAQLAVGLIYALPLWLLGLRETPNLTLIDITRLLPVAGLNALGHYSAVAAMFQKGGGSFTHVIKASEPVVSVILGILLTGTIPKVFTAISLLPITYGVAYASTLGNLNITVMKKELTSTAAKLAMSSNLSFSLRSIVRKNLPSDFKSRTKLTAANEHAVTTTLSIFILLPFLFIYEDVGSIFHTIQSFPEDKFQSFLINLTVSGLSLYLYNEMQNIILASLGPVPTAVGNTFKRVVIFVALYYCTAGETFPVPKIIGCTIAITGCLAFAIFDSYKI